jgi:protein arginine N-methyltransferase 1
MDIIKSYSPFVEINAKSGCWSEYFLTQNIHVTSFDEKNILITNKKKSKTIKSPEVFFQHCIRRFNLFVQLPSKSFLESIASFRGEYILLIGQIDIKLSLAINTTYNNIIISKIEMPDGIDILSVWKRFSKVPSVNNSIEDNTLSGNNENSDDWDDNDSYADFNRSYFSNLYEQEKMLFDKQRMQFYYSAISTLIKKGHTVIDVGTGTGILAAFAEKAGADKIYAIDHSCETLEHAKKIALSNNLRNIEYHEMHSTEFNLDENDYCNKVDVILHEQMGDCLFDEDMVSNIIDLRNRLLKKNGLILPNHFEFFVEPIQIDDSRHVPFLSTLNTHGIDFACMEDEVTKQDRDYFHLRSSDPSFVKHMLCEPKPIYSIDLHTLVEDEMPHTINCSRTITTSGRFDGYAVYFRVNVDVDKLNEKTKNKNKRKKNQTTDDTSNNFNNNSNNNNNKSYSLSTGPHDKNRAPHWGYRVLRCHSEFYDVNDVIDISLKIDNWIDINSWSWTQNKIKGGDYSENSSKLVEEKIEYLYSKPTEDKITDNKVNTNYEEDNHKKNFKSEKIKSGVHKENKKKEAEEAISFISIAELNKLRSKK